MLCQCVNSAMVCTLVTDFVTVTREIVNVDRYFIYPTEIFVSE